MRIEYLNPNKFDQTFENIAVERLVEAAYAVRDSVRRHCPVGTISRPIYKSGLYAGAPWTSRDSGRLKRSVRVTRERTKAKKALSKKKNVRVYAGSLPSGVQDDGDAYYAPIVEFYTPFMRPGLASALGQVKEIIGAK